MSESESDMRARDPLTDALVQTSYAVMAALGDVAATHGLSLPQLRVLAILRGRSLRMSDLAAHMGLEKSSLSGLVDRAEQRGLVTRAPASDDRRATTVALTARGDEYATTLADDVRARLERHLDDAALTEADRTALVTLLTRLLH